MIGLFFSSYLAYAEHMLVYNYASADQSNSAYGLKFVFREFKSA
jgi:hypothetical protein